MRLDVSLFRCPATEERRNVFRSRLRSQPVHLGTRKEALGQLQRICLLANLLHVNPDLPTAAHRKDGRPMRMRQIEPKVVDARMLEMKMVEMKIVEMNTSVPRKFGLPIRGCPETNLPCFDLQVTRKTLPERGSADNKLIARLRKFESCRPSSLLRIEQLKQAVGFLIPCDEINLPDVNFIIRQDAIEMQQSFRAHRLKYHGQREAAK